MRIDLAKINSIPQFHQVVKEELDFSSFYGMNWDAFWDSITSLTKMPQSLVFINWNDFENRFKRDASILKKIIDDFNEEYPNEKIEIIKNEEY